MKRTSPIGRKADRPDPTAGFRFPKGAPRPDKDRSPIQTLVDRGVVTYGASLAHPKPLPALRCRGYLDWVALQQCCCPGCKVDPAGDPHHEGPRGVGQKTDDLLVVPLCRMHHNFVEGKLHLPGLSREQTDALFAQVQVRLLVRWLREQGVWQALQAAGMVPR